MNTNLGSWTENEISDFLVVQKQMAVSDLDAAMNSEAPLSCRLQSGALVSVVTQWCSYGCCWKAP